jgi:WD40 associated region in TFIID subunit, NTD2 domain
LLAISVSRSERLVLLATGFSQAEAMLKKESGIKETPLESSESPIPDLILLLSGKESQNPAIYEQSYGSLRTFIDNSIDKYKSEMRHILYPLFIHIYLTLVERNLYEQGTQSSMFVIANMYFLFLRNYLLIRISTSFHGKLQG